MWWAYVIPLCDIPVNRFLLFSACDLNMTSCKTDAISSGVYSFFKYLDALEAFFFYEFSTDFIYKEPPWILSIGYSNLFSGIYIEAI